MIRLATKEYVPATGDDWYERRRRDEEGTFFRKVADQGPRKGVGGGTRQGIYCLTASGKLLAYKNAQDASVMREALEQGLKRWKASLPPSVLREPSKYPLRLRSMPTTSARRRKVASSCVVARASSTARTASTLAAPAIRRVATAPLATMCG